MSSVTSTMDDLVKDYLLFRGFTQTLKSLDAEIKADKDRGFRAEKIMDLLHGYVHAYDINSLREFWSYLDSRFFSRLEHVYMSSVRKLEVSLFKWYVINALQNNKQDKVTEFFEKLGQDPASQVEWRDWFSLPFTKNPEDVQTFQMYFTKQWQDTFLLSLHNFLSVIFQSMPLPSLLMFDDDLRRMKKLQKECDHWKRIATQISTDSTDYVPDMTQFPDPKPKQVITYNTLELVDDFYDQSSNEENIPRAPVVDEERRSKGMSKIFGRKNTTPSSPTPKLRNATVSIPQPVQKRPVSKEGHSKSVAVPAKLSTIRQKRSSGDVIRAVKQPEVVEQPKMTSREPEPRDLGVPETDGCQKYILLSQDEYSEHHSAITHCRFSDSGKHVASADMDGVVKIWGLNPTPTTISTIMSKASIMCFEWASKMDRLILLGNKASQLKLYDIKEKKNLIDVSLDPRFPRITALLSNPSGTNFVCAASSKGGGYLSEKSPRSGQLTYWSFKTMEKDKEIPTGPHSSAVTSMTFNHNGQLLLLGTTTGSIRLIDVQNTNCIAAWPAHNGDVYTVQFSHDETSCFSLGADGRFVQWSVHNNGALVRDFNFHSGISGPFAVSSMTGQKTVVTPRGRLFACDGDRQCALTCKSNSGVIYSLVEGGASGPSGASRPLIELGGHKSPVITVDWSGQQDSRQCLTGSMDGKILLSTLLK